MERKPLECNFKFSLPNSLRKCLDSFLVDDETKSFGKKQEKGKKTISQADSNNFFVCNNLLLESGRGENPFKKKFPLVFETSLAKAS